MLGRVIYRTKDREEAADLFAALTCRCPTKGLELTRDGDLHIIKAAGNTDVIDAFLAGMSWDRGRVAMVGIHGQGIGEMDSNGGA